MEKTSSPIPDTSLFAGGPSWPVGVLVDILGGDDPVLRLRAAAMTLDHFFKIRELQELDQRLKRFEEARSTGWEIH